MSVRSARNGRKSCPNPGRRWQELCNNTSMHGLKYTVDASSSWIVRCMWIIVFLLGLATAVYFCWLMWKKWDESPILMSFDTNDYALKNIPFPAITICSVNKISKARLLGLLSTSRFENVTFPIMQDVLRYITRLDLATSQKNHLRQLHGFLSEHDFTMEELVGILKRTAPSCETMVLDCTWKGHSKPCLELFQTRPTDDGLCCTFNGGNFYDHELGINYVMEDNEPLKVNGHGYRMGLSVVLDADTEDYSVTNGNFDGFKVLLHSPEDFPNVADRGFVLGPGSVTYVGVKGVASFHTDPVSEKIPITKRNCVLNDEYRLNYFSNYSASACVIECATKLMLKKCGCRPYFFRADKGDKLCELELLPCVSQIYNEVVEFEDTLCDCPPTCSNIWYNPEISYAPFPGQGFPFSRAFERLTSNPNVNSRKFLKEYLKSNVNVVHVYYKDKTGDRYKVDIRYGLEDFISAMGGLLGFGFGFSVISIMEIIYFLCIKCCSRKRFGRQNVTQTESSNPLCSPESQNAQATAPTLSIPSLNSRIPFCLSKY